MLSKASPKGEGAPERRTHIGIYTLQSVSFPAILHKKAVAGDSLATAFFFVLQKNILLWSAVQF